MIRKSARKLPKSSTKKMMAAAAAKNFTKKGMDKKIDKFIKHSSYNAEPDKPINSFQKPIAEDPPPTQFINFNFFGTFPNSFFT